MGPGPLLRRVAHRDQWRLTSRRLLNALRSPSRASVNACAEQDSRSVGMQPHVSQHCLTWYKHQTVSAVDHHSSGVDGRVEIWRWKRFGSVGGSKVAVRGSAGGVDSTWGLES